VSNKPKKHKTYSYITLHIYLYVTLLIRTMQPPIKTLRETSNTYTVPHSVSYLSGTFLSAAEGVVDTVLPCDTTDGSDVDEPANRDGKGEAVLDRLMSESVYWML